MNSSSLKEQKNNLVTTLNKLDVVMNQNYHKQTFKCFSCDHKGGMFDLYSYYQSEVVGNPNYIGDPKSDENRKQARNDLVQILGGYNKRKMGKNFTSSILWIWVF